MKTNARGHILNESPVILTNGSWMLSGSIRVWQPREDASAPETPDVREPLRVVDPIACAVCFARITQRCRTTDGRVTHPHRGRLKLACPCGEPRDLANSRECATCRIRVDEGVVERLLDGQRIDSRPAEKTEALRRWMETGGSERAFCRLHGWKHGRYTPKREQVAA